MDLSNLSDISRDLREFAKKLDDLGDRCKLKASRLRDAAAALLEPDDPAETAQAMLRSNERAGGASDTERPMRELVAVAATNGPKLIAEIAQETGLDRKQVTRVLSRQKHEYERTLRDDGRPVFRYKPSNGRQLAEAR